MSEVKVVPEMSKVKLSIDHCPKHDYWAISLSSIDPESMSSLRLTPEKCCGRWDTVKEFVVNGQQIVEEIECEMDR